MSAPLDHFLNAQAHLLFTSSDLEEVCSMVGRVMKPHGLTQRTPSERLDARMHHIALGDVSVSRLRYGAAVEIEPGMLEDFFLVQMPLSGSATIDSDGQRLQSTPQLASVLSPQSETRMAWNGANDQLMLRIARPLLERTLVGHLGHALDRPLRFDLGFEWQSCPAWRCALSYLLDCANQWPALEQHKLLRAQIEQLIASVLLSCHTHNFTEVATGRRGNVLPRHVKRAQEYMQAHAHQSVTIDHLAQVAGVSVRSLYTGFKDFLGVSPMQFLRELRMERARAELLSSEGVNVSAIALRWGFAHLGRFSHDYKTRYGEAPSQTLRNS